VLAGHIASCDRYKTGEASFACEHVVMGAIKFLIVDIKAYVKKTPPGVIQEFEIHLSAEFSYPPQEVIRVIEHLPCLPDSGSEKLLHLVDQTYATGFKIIFQPVKKRNLFCGKLFDGWGQGKAFHPPLTILTE
jgi:hypothetical protein